MKKLHLQEHAERWKAVSIARGMAAMKGLGASKHSFLGTLNPKP